MIKIFIDGEHGTTGLQIRNRLKIRNDLDILSIPEAERRNTSLRTDYLRMADIAILCLPDDVAQEAVQLLEGYATRIIDSSTAHRTAPGWVYGFAEMTKKQKHRISAAQYVSNPGCYPTGAIALIRPLRESGLLAADYPLSINAVSGYTGGGKQLIAQIEDRFHSNAIHANYFLYSLTLKHKHVPEIMVYGQLSKTPIFTPGIGRFTQGMVVCIPLHLRLLEKKVDLSVIYEIFCMHYQDQDIVEITSYKDVLATTRIDAEELAQTDRMKIYITGTDNTGIVNLVAILDNLGKGASGAAIQNLDLMLKA
ncbi:MAG: N-acetyl-gamma-glutamyl-phosphate reductase [Candidatus Tokpelaia sp. JSC189]|nr:MAG: N-acetyl-gamma-glutamyl-phosphate reductase [Candidatus Tokpelaia sp. JSC189]